MNEGLDANLRQQAIQIAAQLPDDVERAIQVLRYAEQLVTDLHAVAKQKERTRPVAFPQIN
jgi:hypothetical protein